MELSVIHFSLNISFPISDNIRINIGGRKSYFDVWLAVLESFKFYESLGYEDVEITPTYDDYNFFFDWKINDNFYFQISAIASKDDSEILYLTEWKNRAGKLEIAKKHNKKFIFWNKEMINFIFKNESLKNEISISHYSYTNRFHFQ